MTGFGRVGAERADVVLFNKGGREARLAQLSRGEEVPREFFYGYFDLQEAGIPAAMLSSAGPYPGLPGFLADLAERSFARVTRLGARPFSARLLARHTRGAKVLISNTDGFSLSMGLGLARGGDRPALMGGFQGLCDIEAKSPAACRSLVRTLIRRALSGLDHVFFLSPADLNGAVARYGLDRAKAGIFDFGVDTEFWRPCADVAVEDWAFAIGQDWNRDFATLVSASGDQPVRIVTSLPVEIPPARSNVTVTRGDFRGREVSDLDLRRLYAAARMVVVPSRDVHQPTGQSVTLQAMSCGRPVIVSRIKGLWAPDLLVDGENCLLVPPGDAAALAAALGRLRNDPDLAARLGHEARETVMRHFGLRQMGQSMLSLARRGLSLHARRAAVPTGHAA